MFTLFICLYFEMATVSINDLTLGESTSAGHEIYANAEYHPPEHPERVKKVIFKKNKYNNPQYSCLEIAFSQLASLFLPRHCTPPQHLVVDEEGHVRGVMVDHISYMIEQSENHSHVFYSLNPSESIYDYVEKPVHDVNEIPYYFLNTLSHGYFDCLLESERLNLLSIDYDSLARVLASSYTLEEDDLHKGNFGIYIIKDQEKPKVVFFKIDHDLMFVDSIMSFYYQRPTHWVNSETAFSISAEDLLDFPDIKDSKNGYWPTRISFFSNPWGTKEYHDRGEVRAFAKLKANPQFQKAKWMSFYKHILIPEPLIKQMLESELNQENPVDRAQIALITAATIARQARLRSVLFSLQEFRNFVASIDETEEQYLIDDIMYHVDGSFSIQEPIMESLKHYKTLCQSEQEFEEGDTPLHVAIKLGDYRYEETLSLHEAIINTKNSKGKTPLDVALEMQKQCQQVTKDLRQDLKMTMRHLVMNGARKSKQFNQWNKSEHIERYRFKNVYMNKAKIARTYEELNTVLRDIGEDNQFCLKYKKNLAIACISCFIKHNKDNSQLGSQLLQLKKDINGLSNDLEPTAAAVQYIRQLRSKLWIIRLIRGLYGCTSTQNKINDLIAHHLDELKQQDKTEPCLRI